MAFVPSGVDPHPYTISSINNRHLFSHRQTIQNSNRNAIELGKPEPLKTVETRI